MSSNVSAPLDTSEFPKVRRRYRTNKHYTSGAVETIWCEEREYAPPASAVATHSVPAGEWDYRCAKYFEVADSADSIEEKIRGTGPHYKVDKRNKHNVECT